MLQCSVSKEYQRLKDSEVLQRQKLEASNHRITELENQLAKKDKLILDQKKLLEETKTQSRFSLSLFDFHCVLSVCIYVYVTTTVTQPFHLDSRQENKAVCVCVRAELSACECRYLALRRITQTLQAEMFHLYSQIHLGTHGRSQDVSTR